MTTASLLRRRPRWRTGDRVRVKPLHEILATLDENGQLGGLAFMPEMAEYCGRELAVYKSAHKTCDTIDYIGARWVGDALHLTDARCDGQAHGGCQARCLLFWRSDWLESVDTRVSTPAETAASPSVVACSAERLQELTALPPTSPAETAALRYRCQATEMNSATRVLPWWDLRQYVLDVTTGNVRVYQIVRALAFWMFMKLLRLRGYRFWMWIYKMFAERGGGIPFPFDNGTCTKTVAQDIGLQSGELVQVKSYPEILATLNARNRNRGLAFDEEMVGFCGGAHQVHRRVDRIIDEKTGRMLTMATPCIVLEGATCRSRFKSLRLFCPRSVDLYWREIWLRRVDAGTASSMASPYQREDARH